MRGRRSLARSLSRSAAVLLTSAALMLVGPSPAAGATNSQTLFLSGDAATFNPQVHRMLLNPAADSTLTLRPGSSAVWVSDRTFLDGRFSSADHFQLQLGWKDLPCQPPKGAVPDCRLSITSGFCEETCQTVDPPAVVFQPYQFPAAAFPNGSIFLAADSPELEMSGCPCRLYVRIETSAPGPRTWELRTGSASQLVLPVSISSSDTPSPLVYITRNPELLWLGLIGLAVVAVLVLVFLSYNRFISQRNLMRDSWADVDTELRRRYDLIPNLVQVVEGYAAYENALLAALAQARATAMAARRRRRSPAVCTRFWP
ncbi:MAG: LemA family protein [Chloroflexi bacterium]|nr:MAG: LemA family protein [Chloroflexota bacterium]